jgi:HlyD family secretion protein
MTDLNSELASLRIDRDHPGPGPWRKRALLLMLPAALLLGALYALRVRQAMSVAEVATVKASISQPGQPSVGSAVLTASGYVVARRKAVVSAKIQGRLASLRVEEGSRVREGEVIARLESTDYEAQVQRARAQLQRAQADLSENQRQTRLASSLAKDAVLSSDALEAAESRVKLAEAGVAQAQADLGFAQAQLQNTLIRAPFTGVVVRKMAEVGESVAPIPPGVNLSTSSGAVVALADLDTLEVEADVAEANVARLADEQPAEVTVEAFPGQTYKAVLRQVIPTADRTKATVQVKVTIIDKDKNLKPEMSAKVTFLEREQQAAAGAPPAPPVVSVPAEAVVTRGGKQVVFEVRETAVKLREVVAGTERQGQYTVKQGLSGGEVLVSRPPESMKDGDEVKVKS